MAISLVNTGTWNASNLSSFAHTLPSSLVVGNILVLMTVHKDNTSTAVGTATTPSGWTAGATGQSGTVVSGTADTGSHRVSTYTRVVDGTEGTTVTCAFVDNDPMAAMSWQFSYTGTSWSVATGTLLDTTATGTSISGAASIDIDSGDAVCAMLGVCTDTGSHSSQSFTTTGSTYGTVTWTNNQTSNGSDLGTYHMNVACTAGADSGNTTYSATASVSGQSDVAVGVVRLRQVGTAASPSPPSLFLDNAAIIRSYYW